MSAATTRHAFDEELEALLGEVLTMANLAGDALHLAVRVLTEHDGGLVAQVMAIENRVDALNLEIETKAVRLLALQQPMARDLRTITAVLRIITDVERVADYAVDTARQAEVLSTQPPQPIPPALARMAEVAERMLRETLQAFVRRDLDMATRAVQEDDQVDRLYREVRDALLASVERDPALARPRAGLLLIAVYLERIADHITNISERIWYMETGELRELHQ